MPVFDNNEQRTVFNEIVRESILGPGACKNIFVTEDLSSEIINRNPVELYYSGLLFPKGNIKDEQEDDEDENNHGQVAGDEVGIDDEDDDDNSQDATESESDASWQEKYRKNTVGMIFCVADDTQNVEIEFSYAKYARITKEKIHTVKVRIEDVEKSFEQNKTFLNEFFTKLNENNIYEIAFVNGISHRLDQIIQFSENDKSVYLSQRPTRNVEGENVKLSSSDIKKLLAEINKIPDIENKYSNVVSKLEFLFSQAYYQRKQHRIQYQLNVQNVVSSNKAHKINGVDDIQFRFKIFTRSKNGVTKKYVKIILENANLLHIDGDDNSSWKLRSLFQTEIIVRSGNFVDYKDLIDNVIDEENSTTEYLYRNEKSYGKGISCAIQWNDDATEIKTSYLPEVYIRDFSNVANDQLQGVADIFKLKNISTWTAWTDAQIIGNLTEFARLYALWQVQQNGLAQDERDQEDIYQNILEKQAELYNRLVDNIKYIKETPKAFECFKIANTAMYLQMIIARDPLYEKNRELNDINEAVFNNLNEFQNKQFADTTKEPIYRPFQLAFLLMNIKSTFEQQDNYRKKVDLIWFPTGGGKTEAYLALTALTIIARRKNNNEDLAQGVSVIMRYTLRLLTAQQFERATFLICALEFLRTSIPMLNLGNNRISIGMWVGGGTTPNRIAELAAGQRPYGTFLSDVNNALAAPHFQEINQLRQKNKFPITYCPWCGCKLITTENNQVRSGYDAEGRVPSGKIKCVNDDCHFSNGLPIAYIDEAIYNNPPTLLFGTVDKFANLTAANGHRLFNSKPTDKGLPPDLIIQDELHLISGPLGSMVGLFESIIELMCSKDGRTPKIIASTATTRNTKYLVKQLYNREVCIFPAQGVTYDDNFFSYVDTDSKRRMHVGIIPTGHTSVMTEIKLVALLIIARANLFIEWIVTENQININNVDAVFESIKNDENRLVSELDNYWTLVLYYNSLKDLGRTKSRIPQEIYETLRTLKNFCIYPTVLNFIIERFQNRVDEFTSREDSTKIKSLLTKAENQILLNANEGKISVNQGIDLMMASNMISVGIDIPRLNVMVFAGQPRSVSEYIQSSSRVARNKNGIVFNLLNPNRIRELSLFENYTAFHKVYYKYVEPLSATPYTEATIDRLLCNIVVCYVRHIKGLPATLIADADIDNLKNLMSERCENEIQQNYISSRIDAIYYEWVRLVGNGTIAPRPNDLMAYRFFESSDDILKLMKSLRSVDPDYYAKIGSIHY